MSSELIAARSGITKRTVLVLSRRTTWDGHLNYFDRFTQACGVNLENRHAQRYRRFHRDEFSHLKRVAHGDGIQAKFYVELMDLFVKAKARRP